MIKDASPMFELLFNPFLPHTFNLVAFGVWLLIALFVSSFVVNALDKSH